MAEPCAPTILVVDDDEAVTRTFAEALRLEGYDVRTAASAQMGLREAHNKHADAIILDLRMPLINGLGFLYRLRSQDEYRDTPVAIVTGDFGIDDDVLTDVRALGAQLLFKPVWLEDLLELTRTLLGDTHRTNRSTH